ncbi:MAG: hypothetical protein JSW34_12250 [Candidatus Zixiibacteriota bacterium]|nr:MAG: hypothetical protein JSW34_12250 [candidate division Zixibacteria bacterium]
MESWLAPLMVFAIMGMVALMIRTIRNRREMIRQVRMRLGFSPVDNLEQDLLERISSIAGTGKHKVRVSRLYKRDQGSSVLYDCHISSSQKSNSGAPSSVLVVRGLDLPAFRLAARFASKTMFSGIFRQLTKLALKQGGFEHVEFSHIREFADKYTLVTTDPDRLRSEVPEDVWHGIAGVGLQLFLRGEGDVIVFSAFDWAARRQRGGFEAIETERLKQAIDTASRLSDLFGSIRRGATTATWR